MGEGRCESLSPFDGTLKSRHMPVSHVVRSVNTKPPTANPTSHPQPALSAHRQYAMSHFRAARLDLGSFVNVRNLRDHTKRKVFAEFEPERCVFAARPRSIHPVANAMCWQASAALRHPQYFATPTCPRPGPARAHPDARLHPLHPIQEQVYNGRQGKRYHERLQDGSCKLPPHGSVPGAPPTSQSVCTSSDN